MPPLLAVADFLPPDIRPLVFLGVVLAFAGLGIAYTAIITDSRIERSRHDAIRVALEKGLPIPADLATSRHRRRSRDHAADNDRRSGIITIAVSIGVFVFLTMFEAGRIAYIAVIPGCVGAALLLNWMIDRGRPSDSGSAPNDPRS